MRFNFSHREDFEMLKSSLKKGGKQKKLKRLFAFNAKVFRVLLREKGLTVLNF